MFFSWRYVRTSRKAEMRVTNATHDDGLFILCDVNDGAILCRMEWGNFKCCGRPLGSSDDMRQDVWMLVFKQTSLCQTKKWTKWTNSAYFPGIAAYKVFVSFRVFRCLNRKFRDFCDFCVTFRYSFALRFCSYSWYKIREIIAELTKFTLYSHLKQPILAQMPFMWKIDRTFDPCNEVIGAFELDVSIIKRLKIRAAW